MPPPYILTMRDQILYEFATVMSRLAFGKLEHGYIYDRFKLLRDGRLHIAATIRGWEETHSLPRQCVFCGSKKELTSDRLIPKCRGGSDSPDNAALVCRACVVARGNKGIFEWLGPIKKDALHPIGGAKYLMQLLEAHEAAGTLEVTQDDIDGFCRACPLPGVCEEWATEGKLTCFCLESVLPLTTGGGNGNG